MEALEKKNRTYWERKFSILPKTHQPLVPEELKLDIRARMKEEEISMHKLGRFIVKKKLIPHVDSTLIFNMIRNILNGNQKRISYTVFAMATYLSIDVSDYEHALEINDSTIQDGQEE